MRNRLVTLLLVFISTSLLAQHSCNIEDEFGNIFKVEKATYGNRMYLNQTINQLKASECYAELVNSNKEHITYLRQHFTSTVDFEKLRAINDSEDLQLHYAEELKNDTKFYGLIQQMLAAENNNLVKDTISFNQMLNIAVKYFTIKGITEEGNYEGKVCAGINGLKWTEEVRQPHLEAFCFSAIITNLKSGTKPDLQDEFIDTVKDIYTLNLGIDRSEELLRAQGAVYALMKNSEMLRDVLKNAYEDKKQYLPFYLDLSN